MLSSLHRLSTSENWANDHEDSPGSLANPIVSIVPACRSPAYQVQADPRRGCVLVRVFS